MKSYLAKSRLVPLVLIFGMILLIFCGVLYNTQILNGSDYKARSLASNATAQTVAASRGIITDRNGKVLISNRLTYTLVFSDEEFEGDTDCNDAIFRLLELCRSNNVKWTDTLPVSKEPPFTYTTPTDEGAFRKYLESEDLPAITVGTLRPTQEAPLFMAQLRKLYGVADSYSDTDARAIIGVRYQLALRDIAGGTYTFASDVSVELINQVVDGRYAGVTTGTASARVYDTTYAAHVLGRLSPIYQEDWVGDPDNGIVGYRDKGYSMDALVGESGVEKAFEEYLHGENGTKLITTTSDGQITGEFYTKEPKPGNTVALTLDIDLQEDVEKALSKTISDMTEADGIRRGGAAVVVGVGSGEVLALASYPTYDISKWDEIYDTLASDDEGAPLFNRAIGGTYAPGSTFKPCTAVAALESGVITPSTTILDRGIYDYYSSPQPRCWIYSSYGSTHGRVNVSEAITVSCNYFFYEVGRLTGIKTLDDYATQFGLGQYTGIEIGGPNSAEAKGALASPEYAEANDLEWSDGQTLTAAIGQSYNLFTPLQLANYIATLVGNGLCLRQGPRQRGGDAGQHGGGHQDRYARSDHREPVHLLFQVRGVRRCQDRYGGDRRHQCQQRYLRVLRPLRRSPDRRGGGHREGRRRCGSGGDGGGYPQRLLQSGGDRHRHHRRKYSVELRGSCPCLFGSIPVIFDIRIPSAPCPAAPRCVLLWGPMSRWRSAVCWCGRNLPVRSENFPSPPPAMAGAAC